MQQSLFKNKDAEMTASASSRESFSAWIALRVLSQTLEDITSSRSVSDIRDACYFAFGDPEAVLFYCTAVCYLAPDLIGGVFEESILDAMVLAHTTGPKLFAERFVRYAAKALLRRAETLVPKYRGPTKTLEVAAHRWINGWCGKGSLCPFPYQEILRVAQGKGPWTVAIKAAA